MPFFLFWIKGRWREGTEKTRRCDTKVSLFITLHPNTLGYIRREDTLWNHFEENGASYWESKRTLSEIVAEACVACNPSENFHGRLHLIEYGSEYSAVAERGGQREQLGFCVCSSRILKFPKTVRCWKIAMRPGPWGYGGWAEGPWWPKLIAHKHSAVMDITKLKKKSLRNQNSEARSLTGETRQTVQNRDQSRGRAMRCLPSSRHQKW